MRKNLQFALSDSVAIEAYSREDHSSSSGSRCSTINVLGDISEGFFSRCWVFEGCLGEITLFLGITCRVERSSFSTCSSIRLQ